MTSEKMTQILMSHIRANGLEGNFAAGKIIDQRVSSKTNWKISEEFYHEVVDNVIKTYLKELKREEYNNDFDKLLD